MIECCSYVSEYLLYPVVLSDFLVKVHVLEYAEHLDEIVIHAVSEDCELILVLHEIIR